MAKLLASSWSVELVIAATGAEVRRASEWLDTICRQHNVPPELVERLSLCLNEVLANVITHGGSTTLSSTIRLLLVVDADPEGNKVGVTISDAGIAFNPLSVEKKALPEKLDDASPGGLGLVMINRFSDWLDYRHEDGLNHLTFGARWKRP